MGYRLAIGERTYSSWSLRGWLAFAAFGIDVEVVEARLDTAAFRDDIADFAPARTVPALRLPEGTVVWDSLAIAETVAERHPGLGHWPEDAAARGFARGAAAEMHGGFRALRAACPMNLRCAFEGYAPDAAVGADLARIEALWRAGLDRSGGPWLCGGYSMADAFFAPVAARIVGYGLPVGPEARAYAAAHLAHAPFRAWRAAALAEGRRLEADEVGLPERPWPEPERV